MNPAIDCPSVGRLRTLFEKELPESEESELAAHLDQCDACRDRLARLQEDYVPSIQPDPVSAELSRVRQLLEEHRPTIGNSGWQSAVGTAAKATSKSEATAASLAAELPSGYLQPASDPQLLGCIGHYEILERIGNGGMGVVLKGRDTRLNRMVAIKVLAPHLAASGAARQRFGREARAAAAVTHENVVRIHAVEEINGLPLLVMEYVPGASLREKIDAEGSLDVRRILRIALQTAAGLEAAHIQGVIHRDIKPGNILLENGIEKVRLSDFGLASVSDDIALTQTGCLAGTPQYMSPEQIRGGVADGRSDLFSLGSVIYEMCTGRPAFRGSNPYNVLHRVCEAMPRPIREINPEVPEWLAQIVTKLLQKDPEARFSSAAQVVQVLRERLLELQQPGTFESNVHRPRPIQDAERLRFNVSGPPIKPPAAPDAELPESLLGPAVGLQISAVLQIVVGLGFCMLLAAAGFFGVGVSSGLILIVVLLAVFGFVAGVWQLIAASIAFRKGSIDQLWLAAFLAAFPFSPAWVIGLPIAIWTRFNLERISSREEMRPRATWYSHRASIAAIGILLLTVACGIPLGMAGIWVNFRAVTPPRPQVFVEKSQLQDLTHSLITPEPLPPKPAKFPLGPSPILEIDLERAATGAIAFSRDGKMMAFGDQDGFVRLHFANSGDNAMTLIQSREPIRRLAFSPDGSRLAVVRELAIDLWNLRDQKLVQTFSPAEQGHPAAAGRVLQFFDDSWLLYDCGSDLILFDGKASVGVMSHPSPLASGDISSDGEFAVTGDELGLVKVWKLSDRSLHASFEVGSRPAQVEFLTANLIAVGCGSEMMVCNLEGEKLSEIRVPSDGLASDAPNWLSTWHGEVVVRAGVKLPTDPKHASVVIWRWTNSTLIANFEGVEGEPLGLAVSDSEQRLAIVTNDRVSLFDIKPFDDHQVVVGELNQGTVLSKADGTETGDGGVEPFFIEVNVSRDGRAAISGHRDGSVSVWDLSFGSRDGHWRNSQSPVRAVCFGPSEDYVFSGNDAGNLVASTRTGMKIWEAQVNDLFPNDPSFGVIGLGIYPPYLVYGYQHRTLRHRSGLYSSQIGRAAWRATDFQRELYVKDMEIDRDGTVWLIDDHVLYLGRIAQESDATIQQPFVRWRASEDYLGVLALTGTNMPLVGTALPSSLTAKERDERKNAACVRLIEPEEGRVLRVFPTGPGEVTALAASEWRLVAAAIRSAEAELAGEIIVWDASIGSELVRWSIAETVRDLAFVPGPNGGQPRKLLVAGEQLRMLTLPSESTATH